MEHDINTNIRNVNVNSMRDIAARVRTEANGHSIYGSFDDHKSCIRTEMLFV